jgi:hypothetical protein
MARVTIVLHDESDAVHVTTDFDPPMNEPGVENTPAMTLAIHALAALSLMGQSASLAASYGDVDEVRPLGFTDAEPRQG